MAPPPRILTVHHHEKYAHDNYLYTLDKSSGDGQRLFWCCDQRNNNCRGRIHTADDRKRTFLRLVTPHTCAGDATRVAVTQAMTVVKRLAMTTAQTPSQIREQALLSLPRNMPDKLPSICAIRKVVQRSRNAKSSRLLEALKQEDVSSNDDDGNANEDEEDADNVNANEEDDVEVDVDGSLDDSGEEAAAAAPQLKSAFGRRKSQRQQQKQKQNPRKRKADDAHPASGSSSSRPRLLTASPFPLPSSNNNNDLDLAIKEAKLEQIQLQNQLLQEQIEEKRLQNRLLHLDVLARERREVEVDVTGNNNLE